VSLKALTDTGKTLIEEFNENICNYSRDLKTGSFFFDEAPDYLCAICSNHMLITSDTSMVDLGVSFIIQMVSASDDGKNYYVVTWGNSMNGEPTLEIGWSDNGETAMTALDLSLVASSVTIDCSEIEPAYPESFNPTKIMVSATGVTIYTLSDKNYTEEIFHETGHRFGNAMFDDKILIKFTDGEIYDLFGTSDGEYDTLPCTAENVCNGMESMSGSDIDTEDGDVDYSYTFYKCFYEVTDINTIESIIIFGVEYPLH